MSRTLTKAVVGIMTALMLGGAAQAGEVNITINTGSNAYKPVRYDRDDCRDRRYIRAPDYDDECAGDYYRRPIPERPYWERHRWSRPVYDRPHWYDDDCRLVIKRRVNEWGEMVVESIKVCG